MDLKALDDFLLKLVVVKTKLSKLDYNDPEYDTWEDRLHDLEDEFVDEYGEILEDILSDVHEKYCPDDEVLLPTAYLAQHYLITEEVRNNQPVIDVRYSDGLMVSNDEYINYDCRLVMLPNPFRILFTVKNKLKKIAWEATTNC